MRIFKLMPVIGLMACSANSVKSGNQSLSKIINVNFYLQANIVEIFKDYNGEIQKWEFSYNEFTFIITNQRLNLADFSEYSFTTEKEWYAAHNVFYNYGGEAVIVQYE